MKTFFRFSNLVFLFLFLLIFGSISCTRVGVGSVGLKVSQAGSDRGMQDIPMKTGWVFYNPLFTDIIEYPTFVQTAIWTADPGEGKTANEEISFNSKDGLQFTADINLSYHLEAQKAAHFYVKYKSDDISNFTHGLMRQVARDQFNNVASTYLAEDLYGAKKEDFINVVRQRLNKDFAESGIVIEALGFAHALRAPASFTAAINAKLTATQDAIKAENELRTTEANAKKAVAEAEGKAKAMAAQNMVITPQLLALKDREIALTYAQKWDGKMPTYMGGNGNGPVPFLSVNK